MFSYIVIDIANPVSNCYCFVDFVLYYFTTDVRIMLVVVVSTPLLLFQLCFIAGFHCFTSQMRCVLSIMSWCPFPIFRTKFGQRDLHFVRPSVWTSLPDHVQHITDSLTSNAASKLDFPREHSVTYQCCSNARCYCKWRFIILFVLYHGYRSQGRGSWAICPPKIWNKVFL